MIKFSRAELLAIGTFAVPQDLMAAGVGVGGGVIGRSRLLQGKGQGKAGQAPVTKNHQQLQKPSADGFCNSAELQKPSALLQKPSVVPMATSCDTSVSVTYRGRGLLQKPSALLQNHQRRGTGLTTS